MATIDQNLQQIREAVYGEEVRGSIVGAIEQCYADANDVVKVSENPPVEENVKLWVKPTSEEYKVPTWEEHQAVAEDVDNLKSGVLGNEILPIYGYNTYIDLNAVNINFENPVTENGFRYSLVRCNPGDVFTVNAIGRATNARTWGFIKSDGTLLSTSGSGESVNDVAVAPANAYYFIVNDKSLQNSYYGQINSTKVLSDVLFNTGKSYVPITEWLIGKQYNASGVIISLSYSICTNGYIPIVVGRKYSVSVAEGFSVFFRMFNDADIFQRSLKVNSGTENIEIAFDYKNVTVSIISDSESQASYDFVSALTMIDVTVPNGLAEANNKIDNLTQSLDNSVLQNGRVGEIVEIPNGRTIEDITLYAKTNFRTLKPTYTNPATVTVPSNVVLSLSKGRTIAENVSLERVNSRTKNIDVASIPSGSHTVTINVSEYNANGSTTIEFRNNSNSRIASYTVPSGTTPGKIVENLTFSETVTKLYIFISNSATSGTVTFSDIKLFADVKMASSDYNGIPIAGGGNCLVNGRVYLSDEIYLDRGKFIRRVTKLTASGILNSGTSISRLNSINGNTLFSINWTMSNPLLEARMPNYFCTHFQPETTGYDNESVGMYVYNNSLRFRIPASVADTVDAFKTWYASNDVTVYFPKNTTTEEDLPSVLVTRYNNAKSYELLETVTINEGYKMSVDYNDIYDASGNKIILPRISPENFGAVGDGETDDTDAMQSAINYASLVNGTVECASSAVYLVKGLEIHGKMNFDGRGCTLKANSINPVITTYCRDNQQNGFVKDVVIDMDNLAEKGIYLVYDARRNFIDIVLNNPAINGYGVYTVASTAGCSFNTILGRSENIPGTTFMYINSADMNFDHIDWQNYVIGIDITHKANAIMNNVHGYIARNDLFNDSIFVRTASRLTITNAYPDTQNKFFVINTNRGVSIIGGSSWYNNDAITDMANKDQGYAFYTETPSNLELVSVVGFNFSQPENGEKPYLLSNVETEPMYIGCFTSNDNGAEVLN